MGFGLESADVDKREHKLPPIALGPRELALHRVGKATPVERAGERVSQRRGAQGGDVGCALAGTARREDCGATRNRCCGQCGYQAEPDPARDNPLNALDHVRLRCPSDDRSDRPSITRSAGVSTASSMRGERGEGRQQPACAGEGTDYGWPGSARAGPRRQRRGWA